MERVLGAGLVLRRGGAAHLVLRLLDAIERGYERGVRRRHRASHGRCVLGAEAVTLRAADQQDHRLAHLFVRLQQVVVDGALELLLELLLAAERHRRKHEIRVPIDLRQLGGRVRAHVQSDATDAHLAVAVRCLPLEHVIVRDADAAESEERRGDGADRHGGAGDGQLRQAGGINDQRGRRDQREAEDSLVRGRQHGSERRRQRSLAGSLHARRGARAGEKRQEID